jgi:transposase InsO family protein
MCGVLEVSSAGYDAWRRRQPSARAKETVWLLGRIKALHGESRASYGSPKIYRSLRRAGESLNHKRVERLMRDNGIRAKRARKFKLTTTSRHALPVAGKVLARDFTVARPDAVWTSEIT